MSIGIAPRIDCVMGSQPQLRPRARPPAVTAGAKALVQARVRLSVRLLTATYDRWERDAIVVVVVAEKQKDDDGGGDRSVSSFAIQPNACYARCYNVIRGALCAAGPLWRLRAGCDAGA